ncbi:phosphotransferase family protein [Bacillus sp. B1-b2]|uniref:phosphotransferase family protein n=1 Tax=Bacillus sp. B1-b2 TaxID=2653201 RepID=UPI001262383C|nr:aminoglycoside phosphotransferase family protein [Bacillus sp. B1-b2]KAB7672629.1 aminoglycoside phosphotransferase family protein [Bacillus sp. B1-b2]
MTLGNPIATGNTANLYLLNNNIVKIFKEYLPPTEAVNEAKKQEYAYSCGLSVPKVLEVTKIDGTQAIIMEYIRGETLGELMLKNKESVEHYLNILVENQKVIHAVKVQSDAIESLSERLYRHIDGASSLTEKQKTILLTKLNSFKYEDSLCHGDFHPYNLIIFEGKGSIIDWVDATAGDLRADVCRTFVLLSHFSEFLAEQYLELYSKDNSISKGEILEWLPIIAGARLYENVTEEESERLLNMVKGVCGT